MNSWCGWIAHWPSFLVSSDSETIGVSLRKSGFGYRRQVWLRDLPTHGVWVGVTELVLVQKRAAPCDAKVQATVMQILESY